MARESSNGSGISVLPGWAEPEAGRSAISSRLDRRAEVVGWLAMAAGIVVLAGWWTGHPALAALIPGQQPTSPNSAVGIALVGLTLVGVMRGWNRWIPGIAAAAVFVIGAVTVGEYVLKSSWSGLDGLFAHVSGGADRLGVEERMGANVALNFVLLGIAGILLVLDKAPHVRQGLAAAANSVAVVAVLGYLLGIPVLSGHGEWAGIGMAPATAVLHLALGVALMMVMPGRGWARVFASPLAGGRIARVWMPALLLALIAVLGTTHGYFHTETSEQVGLSVTVLLVAVALLILAGRTDQLDQDRSQEAASAVDRSERRYRLGFEGSPVGIAVVDGDGTFTEVNQALAAMVGKPADAMAGRTSITSLVVPDDTLPNLAFKDRVASGAQSAGSLQTAIVGADGRRIPVKVDASRVDSESDPMIFAFVTDLSEIHEKNRQLAQLAERDPLTGVLNRRGFLDHVQAAVDAERAGDERTALLYIDIDGFKQVNDVYGHRMGDRLLCLVADRLVQNTRADRGQVGRLGGDEFAVLLSGCRPSEVANVARRLERCIREPAIVDGVTLTTSCSIGHSVCESPALDCEDLLARADHDMYAARRARAGGMADKVEQLRVALDAGQLALDFQPIWRLCPDGPKLHGYESLVRWQHPEYGLIPPGEFIPTAEEGGLIHQLDLWAATEALRRFAGQPAVNVAINCSALSLAVPGMTRALIEAIRAIDRDPGSVIVELTESVDIPDSSQIMKSLNELRAEGILIALDDFGSGYAGLNNLRTLPIDIVKIDRSLIATLAEPSDQADNTEHFLTGIRQLTHAMGTRLLAEGIESTRQLTLVQKLGFDYAQGFLLGSPSRDEYREKSHP